MIGSAQLREQTQKPPFWHGFGGFCVCSAGLASHSPRPEHDYGQPITWMGSPIVTALKYHAALSGLKLMQPWLTLA
uniref:Uncharacterized protein n=1 Tax=Mycobacterium riyadhense TaxID=486698 RepID=A0A653EVE8_9MYCO|nr:hypothetical protein BIN_B_04045 [Mycobacterium riyadhense]